MVNETQFYWSKMGRRSYLKRFGKTLSGIKNKIVRIGLSAEKGIAKWAEETSGPQIQQHISSKLNDKVGPM